jgi:hypothetical protein
VAGVLTRVRDYLESLKSGLKSMTDKWESVEDRRTVLENQFRTENDINSFANDSVYIVATVWTA